MRRGLFHPYNAKHHTHNMANRPRYPRTSDEAALDELVRVLAHDLAVLARARLRLVRVHHQEGGAAVRLYSVLDRVEIVNRVCGFPAGST